MTKKHTQKYDETSGVYGLFRGGEGKVECLLRIAMLFCKDSLMCDSESSSWCWRSHISLAPVVLHMSETADSSNLKLMYN